jgi:hypothetical protein
MLSSMTCPPKTKPNIRLRLEGKNFRRMYINGPEWAAILNLKKWQHQEGSYIKS